MEYRVKQRSEEWFRLRQTVMLTASQFADAVGVGKGKPFHFFQSLLETERPNPEDTPNKEKEMMQHGEQMESVIKEAYELLTGLHVVESGFWVPEEGHSMEGLIGASPDGIVVRRKDPSRMLGLAEFKAPVHRLYDKVPGSHHDIPRQHMVQIQGQMAVCGAPWCDYMAVCTETQDMMLKRVFFQPRYWEHISSRLKQFCFAMQEAEIMQELKRDVYSGAMTQRIKKLAMQDKLFPAEDIITVENLLTRSPLQLYRGPSHKLLSYQILVGDSYKLPSALSRYKQDLLARVDAEIQLKRPHLGHVKVEGEEMGQVYRREFCHEGSSEDPVSPERVFREGSALWGKENQDMSTEEGTHSAGSLSSSHSTREAAVTIHVSSNTPGGQLAGGQNSSHPQSDARSQSAAGPFSVQGKTAGAESPPLRKLSRIKTGPRQLGRSRPGVVNSGPRTGGVGRAQSEGGPGPAPRMPGRGRTARGAVLNMASSAAFSRNRPSSGMSKTVVSQLSAEPPASSRACGRFSGQHSAVARNSAASSSPVFSGSSVSPVALSTVPSGLTAVCDGGTSASPSPKAGATRSATMSTTRPVVVCTASVVLNASSTPTSCTPAVKHPVMSARQEWEMTARKKQLVSKDHSECVPETLSTGKAQTQPDSTQNLTKSVNVYVDHVGLRLDDSGQKDKGEPGHDENMDWRAEVFSSGAPFVPSSRTLLSSSTSLVPPTAVDVTTGRSFTSSTQQDKSLLAADGQGNQREQQERPDSGHQAPKRPARSVAEVEAKKPMLDKTPSIVMHAHDQKEHRSSERLPIHRPWQSQEDGREGGAGSDRQALFGRERMDLMRDRPMDLAHQRLLPLEERRESRIASLLDRGREDALPRGFDFDHQDRGVSDDFLQGRSRGQHGLRGNLFSEAGQFDHPRHLPLDLSDRHHRQEREAFAANRASLVGREGALGLERGGVEGGAWRGQFPRQLPSQMRQQSAWQHFQGRSDLPIRTPGHGHWPLGQALRREGLHALDLQPRPLDRRFPDREGRDPRMVDFHGDLIRGQFPRNFPRRPFDY